MNTKVFALTFIALFACQGLVQAGKAAPPKQTKDLEADALAALEELRQILETAIAEANATLNQLLNDLQAIADGLIEQTLAQLQAEANKVIAEIERLKEEAIQLGQDIAVCILGQEEAVLQLPITLGNELVQCITTQVNEAIGIITDAVTLVEQTIDAVEQFKLEIENCNGGLICLTGVIAEIGGATISLPGKIADIVVDTEDLIATIQFDIEACAIQKVAQIIVEAGKILGDVVQCIDNLVGRH